MKSVVLGDLTGYYEDEFVKTEGDWKFATREMHVDSLPILPQLFQLGEGGSEYTQTA